MFRGISRVVTHRAAGVVWCGAAIGLAGALAVSTQQAHRKEDFLRSRIAALASHDASQLTAELVSCRATVHSYAAAVTAARAPRDEAPPAHATRIRTSGHGDAAQMAAELAGKAPAGFDVCARMESADQAVLKALDRR